MKFIFPVIIGLLFFSCKKESGESAQNTSLIIGGFTIKASNSSTDSVTVQFTYINDTIRSVATDRSLLIYTYDSTRKISYAYLYAPNYEDTLYNYSHYSSGSDTIQIGRRQHNLAAEQYDTLQQMLVFKNNLLMEREQYLRNADNATPVSFIREYYTYNKDGNIEKVERETDQSARSVYVTFTAWDNGTSPLYNQPRENFFESIFPGIPQTSSLHNPTAYAIGAGSQQLIFDYNKYNYPLHFYLKSQPGILYNIQYKF